MRFQVSTTKMIFTRRSQIFVIPKLLFCYIYYIRRYRGVTIWLKYILGSRLLHNISIPFLHQLFDDKNKNISVKIAYNIQVDL